MEKIQKKKSSGTPKQISGTITEILSTSLMKKAGLPIITLMVISLLLIPLISALSITEVELNPEGNEVNTSIEEWIELYSENLTNLTDLTIMNHDGGTITLTNISFQGYYIVNFSSQFLDNQKSEVVTLISGNQTLDQTPPLNDSKNNNLTWQYCSWNWTQREQTPGLSNNCTVITSSPQNTTNQTSQNTTNSDTNKTGDNQTAQDIPPEFIPAPSTNTASSLEKNNTIKKIVLNPSPGKSEKEEIFLSKKEKTYLFLLLSFTFLTVVIIILLALRKL